MISAPVEMIPSSGGVFEVVVNDALLFSKKATGQFPNEDVILEQVKRQA